jgi:hypothetical protein
VCNDHTLRTSCSRLPVIRIWAESSLKHVQTSEEGVLVKVSCRCSASFGDCCLRDEETRLWICTANVEYCILGRLGLCKPSTGEPSLAAR